MLDSSVTRIPLTRPVFLTIAAAGLVLTVTAATLAQSKFATVSGTVRDQLGGTIPRVTVTLTQADGGAKHEVKSSESGAFEFVGLPPGNYAFAASSMGFQPVETSLQLAAGQTLHQDLRLEVGTLQETLTVRDGPPANGPERRGAYGRRSTSECSAQPNSGGIKPPIKIADVKPIYPASLQGSGESGRVNLEAIIGVDGTVRTMRTIDATNIEFEQSALDAVGRWRFTPTLLTCVPIEVTMNVAVAFSPQAAAPPPPPPPPPPAPPAR